VDYFFHLAVLCCIYGILAITLDFVVGRTGMLSIAHAAYYAIGAYAVAILYGQLHWPFFAALVLAVAISGVAGFVMGLLISHLEDDFYALSSLAIIILINSLAVNWESLTRGTYGISGIGRPVFFGLQLSSDVSLFVLTFILLLVIAAIYHFVCSSAFGRVLEAIREDEGAIRVFGFNTAHYKLVAYTLSSALAAVAGGLYATFVSYIDPTLFTINESVLIMSMIILGGLARLRGAVLGAVFITLLPEALRFVGFPSGIAGHMRYLTYGLVLVLLMRYRPQGMMGRYKL
jgi:branched-chain amino acid transport system permease protein